MSERKTLVTYFGDKGRMAFPFDVIRNNKRVYYLSYLNFFRLVQKRGLDAYVCRGHSYLGKSKFSNGWKFKDNQLVRYNRQIQADVIYNKDRLNILKLEKGVRVLNYPEFEDICHDKYRTYRLFPEYSPKTYLVKNKVDLSRLLKRVATELAVLKPRVGREGVGIVIGPKEKIRRTQLIRGNDYILQNFLDTSGGIPGLYQGLHDLRIVSFNGEASFSYIRQPKKGSLLANLARGGTRKIVDLQKLPIQVKKIFRLIDNKFKNFIPRVYSADFGYANDRWYLFELNSQPGMSDLQSKICRPFQEKLIKALISLCQ